MMEEKTIKYQELVDVVRNLRGDSLFYFFLSACKNGNLQLCQLCLDAGADINIHLNNTLNLLNYLSESTAFNIKVADWLIEKGVDINNGRFGCSPLSRACQYGDFDMVKYCIDKGSKIHQYKDDLWKSDLCYAVESGNYEIVKLLLELGVNLESDVNYENNPFITSVKKQKSNIVELFLQKGASPNLCLHGRTPLHIAVANKDVENAHLLLKYGADVTAKLQDYWWIKDYLSITPMDIAVFTKDTVMQKLLSDFGGCVSSKDDRITAIVKYCTEYCNGNEISSMIEQVLAS